MGDPVYTFALPTGSATSGPDSILTELRIHGVSGPDPTGILETPATRAAEPAARGVLLAGFSSGSASRALWLLLVPFAFLNVAAWMHPIAAANPEAARADRVPRQDPWNDTMVVWLHRLLRALALCFTLLLVLATLAAAVDVPHQAALRCAAGDGKGWRCSLVRHVWVARPLGLAVTAVVLLVLVGLGRSTWTPWFY